MLGNFNSNVLAQKYAKKGKRLDFQTLHACHFLHKAFVYGIFQVNQGLLQDEGITNEKLKVEVVGVVSIVC